jgi:hypothetical protein
MLAGLGAEARLWGGIVVSPLNLNERIGLIWSDRVNSAHSGVVLVVVVAFVLSRRQSEQQSEQF